MPKKTKKKTCQNDINATLKFPIGRLFILFAGNKIQNAVISESFRFYEYKNKPR